VCLPTVMILDGIDRDADDLDTAFPELILDTRHGTELGRANGREVFGVAEEDGPAIADPFMEMDRAMCRLGGEIRCGVIDAKAHGTFSCSELSLKIGSRRPTIEHRNMRQKPAERKSSHQIRNSGNIFPQNS